MVKHLHPRAQHPLRALRAPPHQRSARAVARAAPAHRLIVLLSRRRIYHPRDTRVLPYVPSAAFRPFPLPPSHHANPSLPAYPFLDPTTQHALLAAYIIGIAVGAVIVFLITRGVAVLRQRAVVRRGLLPGADDGLIAGGGEAIDEWEEVERPVGGGKEAAGAV